MRYSQVYARTEYDTPTTPADREAFEAEKVIKTDGGVIIPIPEEDEFPSQNRPTR